MKLDRAICESCRKRAYLSKRDARKASAAMHQRFHVYRCPVGNGWHVAKEQR